jgi:hypothetical protein
LERRPADDVLSRPGRRILAECPLAGRAGEPGLDPPLEPQTRVI